MQNATIASLAAALAIAVASMPAAAEPVVLNPNFVMNDTATNARYGTGSFFLMDWTPSGNPSDNATNSNNDAGQYDNGYAGGRSVVGFLSGGGATLSQVVQGFVAGMSYKVSVSANARSRSGARPMFGILADGVQVYGPTTLAAVDATGTFSTAFTRIQSDSFIATNTFVTISFANASTSDVNASTLLTSAAVALSSVPEPVSLAILSVGLIGAGVARRRMRSVPN